MMNIILSYLRFVIHFVKPCFPLSLYCIEKKKLAGISDGSGLKMDSTARVNDQGIGRNSKNWCRGWGLVSPGVAHLVMKGLSWIPSKPSFLGGPLTKLLINGWVGRCVHWCLLSSAQHNYAYPESIYISFLGFLLHKIGIFFVHLGMNP